MDRDLSFQPPPPFFFAECCASPALLRDNPAPRVIFPHDCYGYSTVVGQATSLSFAPAATPSPHPTRTVPIYSTLPLSPSSPSSPLSRPSNLRNLRLHRDRRPGARLAPTSASTPALLVGPPPDGAGAVIAEAVEGGPAEAAAVVVVMVVVVVAAVAGGAAATATATAAPPRSAADLLGMEPIGCPAVAVLPGPPAPAAPAAAAAAGGGAVASAASSCRTSTFLNRTRSLFRPASRRDDDAV